MIHSKKKTIFLSISLILTICLMAYVAVYALSITKNSMFNVGVKYQPEYLVKVEMGINGANGGTDDQTIEDSEYVEIYNSSNPVSNGMYIQSMSNDTIHINSQTLTPIGAYGDIYFRVTSYDEYESGYGSDNQIGHNLQCSITCGDNNTRSETLAKNISTIMQIATGLDSLDERPTSSQLGSIIINLQFIEVPPDFLQVFKYESGQEVDKSSTEKYPYYVTMGGETTYIVLEATTGDVEDYQRLTNGILCTNVNENNGLFTYDNFSKQIFINGEPAKNLLLVREFGLELSDELVNDYATMTLGDNFKPSYEDEFDTSYQSDQYAIYSNFFSFEEKMHNYILENSPEINLETSNYLFATPRISFGNLIFTLLGGVGDTVDGIALYNRFFSWMNPGFINVDIYEFFEYSTYGIIIEEEEQPTNLIPGYYEIMPWWQPDLSLNIEREVTYYFGEQELWLPKREAKPTSDIYRKVWADGDNPETDDSATWIMEASYFMRLDSEVLPYYVNEEGYFTEFEEGWEYPKYGTHFTRYSGSFCFDQNGGIEILNSYYKDENPTSKYVIRPTCVLSYVFQQNNDY